MKAVLPTAVAGSQTTQAVKAAMAAKAPAVRPSFKITHEAPASFRPGQPIPLALTVGAPAQGSGTVAVIMHYRHVNQAERWQQAAASADGGNTHKAELDGAYTQTVYPLQYYFELRVGDEKATLYPGFNSELNNQPYFVVQAS